MHTGLATFAQAMSWYDKQRYNVASNQDASCNESKRKKNTYFKLSALKNQRAIRDLRNHRLRFLRIGSNI